MHFSHAMQIAEKVITMLAPFCDRVDIAGSLRRHKTQVKDIEIVCKPLVVETKNLFGEVISKSRDINFIATVKSLGKIVKGHPEDGRYVQIQLANDFMVDLFIPVESDYFRQLVIRTGSATYVHVVIAQAWLNLGWCGVDQLGLRRQSDCILETIPTGVGKKHWKCINKNGERPPAWKCEGEFFNWLKVQWLAPQHREIYQDIKK